MSENDELTRLAEKILQSIDEEDYVLSAIDARKLAKSLLANGVRVQEDLYEVIIKNILENILIRKGKYELPHCFMTERNVGYIEACEDIQTFLEFLLGNK
jgi:hypothetical protein